MKTRFLSVLLAALLVSAAAAGCRGQQGANTAPGASPVSAVNPGLTPEDAQQIALNHAGLTAGQVIGLHADYEIEHGTPIYDVEFHHRAWQFDYEIHADTGEILAFSKDD